MDGGQRQDRSEGAWLWRDGVLHPRWQGRAGFGLLALLMVAYIYPIWFIVFHGNDDVTVSAEGVARLVVYSLDTYSSDDLELAVNVMDGPNVKEMKARLAGLRRQLMDAGNSYEMAVRTSSQTGDDKRVVVTLHVSQKVDLPPELQHQGAVFLDTDDAAWMVTVDSASWPESGWRVTDFVAPADFCDVYWCEKLGPGPSPSETPAPKYPPVFLTCARADSSGAVSKLGNYTVNVDEAGRPDFSDVWADHNVKCVVDRIGHGAPVASSPVELAAVQATGRGNQAVSIGTLYEDCGGGFNPRTYPGDSFRNRVPEYRGVLALCPNHPDAAAIKKAVGG